jgi:tetratricopeptide (TPR) repeat protein
MERGEAQAFAEEALSIAREIEDGDTTWMALQALAIACDVQGDRGTALGHYEESLALARKGGSKQRIATTLHNLAELRRGCGEMDGAAPLYEEALALAREQGDRSANTAVTLRCLAVVSIERGLGDRARAMLFEAFEIVRETGSKFAGATALNGCAELAAFFGEWKRAARLHGAADAQGQKMGLPRAPATAPLIERVREAIGAPACDASETAGRVMMYEEAIAEARAWLQDAH